MENKDMQMFDWVEFKNGNQIVVFNDEDDLNFFLKGCAIRDIKWNGGQEVDKFSIMFDADELTIRVAKKGIVQGMRQFADDVISKNKHVKIALYKYEPSDNLVKNKYVFYEYDKGDISDGSHTFNELYNHRMILFSIIVNSHPLWAWKSKLHDDSTMFDDYFIVGIETPQGQFTYHYHIDHWKMFEVKELDRAPKWDGHTSDDITRLLSLADINLMPAGE